MLPRISPESLESLCIAVARCKDEDGRQMNLRPFDVLRLEVVMQLPPDSVLVSGNPKALEQLEAVQEGGRLVKRMREELAQSSPTPATRGIFARACEVLELLCGKP